MQLPIAGRSVTGVSFDYAITVLVEGSALRFETTVCLHGADGEAVSIDPESAHAAASHLVLLRDAVVTHATALDDGALEVQFEDGRSLKCSADSDYEAWTFAGSAGEKVVCLPGGGLSVWDAPQT